MSDEGKGEIRPRRNRVTMQDVAREAGVSQSTVSFVLNNVSDMRIGEETRRRVQAAAQTLGYRPRGLRRPGMPRENPVIGVLIDEIATSPMAAISLEAIQESAWKSGIVAEIAMSGGDTRYEDRMLNKWAQDGVAGVIFGSVLTRSVVPPKSLFAHRSVLMNCYDADGRIASITPAERRGGEAATRALLAAGHRRIAFITGEPWMEASIQRLTGFRRAMAEAGVAVDEALVIEGNFLPSGGRTATLHLLRQYPRPDAIFCGNDLAAVGCYEALKENGLRPGVDLGVMGYDDQEIAQHLTPALSTVLLPHREMGQWCVELIIAGETVPRVQERIACPVVMRESVGRGDHPSVASPG